MHLPSSDETAGEAILHAIWRRSAAGLVTVFTFGAFINVLKFAMPLYTLQVLDRIPGSRSVETLIMLTAIALPAVLAGVALEAVRQRMLMRWGAWFERLLGPRLCLSGISGARAKQGQPATDALNELSRVRSFVERSAAAYLDVLWAPVFVVAVYLVHPAFGAILVSAIAAVLLLCVAQEKMTREPRRASGDATRDARSIVAKAERSAELVGALNMAPHLTRRWHENVAARHHERDRTDARNAVFAALVKALYRSLYIGGMGVGIWLVIEDSLTVGGVIAGNIMMRFGFRLVDKAVRRWRPLVKANRAYRRLKSSLETGADSTGSVRGRDLASALSLESVSFRYPGRSEHVFRRIDATARPGEILCVVGASAAGKSTFTRLVTGVLTPRSGQVRLGDVEIGRLAPEVLARVVGYLPQETLLFGGSVRDNIARMGQGRLEDVVAAARLAGVHDTIVRLPQGYDTVIDDDAPSLSGGERKRIALARAFFGLPRIVVLDEPEANLDRRAIRGLARALKALREQGSIVIVTTQSTRLAKIADRTLILGGGRVQVQAAEETGAEEEPGAAGESGPAAGLEPMTGRLRPRGIEAAPRAASR